MRLDPARFDVWFRALNGQEPFPWQRRLFREWGCPDRPDQARWPRWLELPTASGKTALIDLAVLALAAGSPSARRRIAFVVDRRVVVDEAARRAAALADSLKTAAADPASPLYEVAQALAALGGGEPLLVATLRGGIPSDDRWARSPEQPAVLLSTVDQVGSRLLFRAYGEAGPRAWPIHAGLLGRDSLIFVDEAHCARPFCQTLTWIAERWQHFAENPVGAPIGVVLLSATLGEEADFGLEEDDRRHPVLGRRLGASKPVELVLVDSRRTPDRRALVEAIVGRAGETLSRMRSGVLGIVVNRVRDARAIYEALPVEDSRKLLLTGKVRPWERDRLIESWLPWIQAGRSEAPAGPVAVVATQCIEVGANFDFDFLISEIAPLDALRQRFGRLDRLGERAARIEAIGAGELSPGAIVALSKQVDLDRPEKSADPIYGAALGHTWRWLVQEAAGSRPVVDFGIEQLQARLPRGDELARLCQPAPAAYRLLPAHLDLLVQTSPPPEPDPEIGAFLHGVTQAGPDVTIVWRADLPEDNREIWIDRVAVQPPAPGEGCTVPIWECRKWLSAAEPGENDGGDLEAAVLDRKANGSLRWVLRWRGPSESETLPADGIRPGDVIVVPAGYGGCDRMGWNPASAEPVQDIGDAVAFTAGRRPVLRLDAAAGHLDALEAVEEARRALDELRRWAAGEPDAEEPAVSLRRIAATGSLPEWLRRLAERLAADARLRAVEVDGSFAVLGRKGLGEDWNTAAESSLATSAVTLAEHSRGVEDWVRRFAERLDLPGELRDDLSLAAWLHDVGKADPRFQVWLHGGDEIAASLADQPLAKSGLSARDWRSLRRARQMARYPDGARHELASVALVSSCRPLIGRAHDWDLVLHLIAAHHGFARPFAPASVDPDPVRLKLQHDGLPLEGRSDHGLERLDGGIAERFWTLVRRYGWWGLAYLEAIFRLADHRRSEEEESLEVSRDRV